MPYKDPVFKAAYDRERQQRYRASKDSSQPRGMKMADYAWQDDANCKGVDPNLFFPERGAAQSVIAQAKAVCQGCKVRKECLNHALTSEHDGLTGEYHGIWGGYTGKELRKLRRERTLRQDIA